MARVTQARQFGAARMRQPAKGFADLLDTGPVIAAQQLNQLVGLAGLSARIKGDDSVGVLDADGLSGLAHGWSPDEARHRAGPTTQSPDNTLVGARAQVDSSPAPAHQCLPSSRSPIVSGRTWTVQPGCAPTVLHDTLGRALWLARGFWSHLRSFVTAIDTQTLR